MEELTVEGKTFEQIGDEAKKDSHVKSLLKYRSVLSRILKFVVPELKDLPLETIEKECFASEIRTDVPVEDSRAINQKNPELHTIGEKDIIYDLYFQVRIPDTDERKGFGIIVDLEAQGKVQNDIPGRAHYYVDRAISAQLQDTKPNDYSMLEKVYSVWIFLAPEKKYANQVGRARYVLDAPAGFRFSEKDFDLGEIVLLFLGKSDDDTDGNEALRFLNILFDTDESVKKRKKQLREIGFPVTKEQEREMVNMSNWGQAMEDKGMDKERRKIMNVLPEITKMLNKGMSIEDIVRRLDVTEEFVAVVQENNKLATKGH